MDRPGALITNKFSPKKFYPLENKTSYTFLQKPNYLRLLERTNNLAHQKFLTFSKQM